MNYGRYRVEKELGKGSMGVVYQAHDPQIDRLVALKVLRSDLVTSEDFVQRFLKEARAIGRLSHPSIVTVYDVGRDHGTIYIAMEFLAGDPFHQVMKEKEFSEKETVQLGIQVAEVLDYAHQAGIFHRDIKPSNIILSSHGQIRITDFGIAHIEDPSAPQLTKAGEVLGTPAYMSPEQVSGQPIDGRSDLYSLGVILYEMSTGRRPFRGENLTALLMAVIQETPRDPIEINSAVSPELSQIIMKCLRKNPDERFQTGKALAKALEDLIREKEPPTVVPPAPKRVSKNLGLIMLIVFLLTGIAGGVSYHLIRKRATEASPPTVTDATSEVRSSSVIETVKHAVLKVESKPIGAQVFVDGGFKGSTPLQVELLLGKHEVRLTLPEHYDWEAQVQLREEGETPLLVRLIPTEGKNP